MTALLKCFGRMDPEIGGFLLGKIGLYLSIIHMFSAKLASEETPYYYLYERAGISVAQIIANVILIIGVIMSKKLLLLPWLGTYMFAIISSLYSYSNVLIITDDWKESDLLLGLSIFGLILTVLDIYSWFCILGLLLKYIEDEIHPPNNGDGTEIPDVSVQAELMPQNLPPPAYSTLFDR